MSRALLSKRLDHLERHGLIVRSEGRYLPTPACEELRPMLFGLAEWGARWAFGEPRPDELDPVVLMWWICGGIDPAPFGGRRVVVHVRVPDARRTRFWFVVEPHDVSLCFTDPGYEVDATIESPLGVLYQVWEGMLELLAAARDGRLTLTGRREVLVRLPASLRLSPVTPYVRRGRAGLPA
ncbi:helix-turn-helix domain-containing protein [Pseudonocardia sp. C8]|uniref:winged helix-turn-helix transcriptional regulator n=1 Tax=Pseudonocardia sp. C8 TaxID=2762759 RepID=UPI001C92E869|nr:transcriptional regulator [Pseudonocardia sp. C8]